MSSIRHTRGQRSSKRRAPSTNDSEEMSQRANDDGANSSGNATQGANSDQQNLGGNACRSGTARRRSNRGRTKRSRTKLRMPAYGQKVQLAPKGDKQFTYPNYNPKDYKYSTQLGVLLKREYPGLVQDKDENELDLGAPRPALDWADYYVVKNDEGEPAADRVKKEFWHLFEVSDDDKAEAYRVFENYATKRVDDQMYQLRVDAVKVFHDDIKNVVIKDPEACSIQLTYDQYLLGRVDWCNEMVWPHHCRRWCSNEFKEKRKKAQESRFSCDDIAQNHGGSRPFGETSQILEYKFGPGKGSTINTYAVMKSGMENVGETGISGPIVSQKAQTRLDDYTSGVEAAHPDGNVREQLDVDGKVLYKTSGGMRHGRLAIADGAVRKVDVLAAAKETNVRPPVPTFIPVTLQHMARENQRLIQSQEHLVQVNQSLTQLNHQLIMTFYADQGKEPPAEILRLINEVQEQQALAQGTTGSSHAASPPLDDNEICHGNTGASDGPNGSQHVADGNNGSADHDSGEEVY